MNRRDFLVVNFCPTGSGGAPAAHHGEVEFKEGGEKYAGDHESRRVCCAMATEDWNKKDWAEQGRDLHDGVRDRDRNVRLLFFLLLPLLFAHL